MTGRPFPETPEAAARNRRVAQVLDVIDELALNAGHARRARVRVAGVHTLARATDDDVRQAVADTVPADPYALEEPPA